MTQAPAIEIDHAGVEEFCRRWKIRELALYGSVLREDFTADSDIDVLITSDSHVRWTFDDWMKMREELERIFGRTVDLVEKRLVRNPFRRYSILTTRRIIYAA